MKRSFFISLSLISLLSLGNAFGQCDSIASACVKHITTEYISDGQQYRALLLDDEVAEFHTTFYGGTTYRIAACSAFQDGDLNFKVLDGSKNEIFFNAGHSNSPYWNFKVNSTTEGIIEAQLNPDSDRPSGCAVLLIGFKQQ